MPVTRDWVLYSSNAVNSSTAKTAVELFQEAESTADDKANETNMPLAGMLPANQSFKINRIEVYWDEAALEEATVSDTFDFSHMATLEVKVNDQRVFMCPLKHLLGQGFLSHAHTTANEATIGVGATVPHEFKHPIEIKGGDAFKVIVTSGVTATTATAVDIQVALIGELTTPS